MAVLLNTSLGDIVIDLYTDQCPLTTKNFLKLCKIKYYNNCLFHSVQKDFLVQTGDPTGTGSGGDSIYKFLYGEQARFFNDEIHQNLKHDKVGIVAMASAGENLNASQFYITTRADLDYLDGKHTVFGVVAEGEDVLMKINEAFVDEKNRPYKNIRIKHTYLLDDPFEDPVQLAELIPENSPTLQPPAEGEEVRLEDDWVPLDEQLDSEELDKSLRRKEAHSRAVVLEMIGDIPDAEIKPPENVLFVCKLNPVTQDEDLEIIFSRFGKVISADIIRDYKTGDSLCYAFIEFEAQEACEAAYFKMDNVLIDDRRIHVDFSQSVSRLWTRYRRFGKKDMDDGKGSSFAPRSKSGCFKCGEFGHLAKDCPNDGETETTQERPKYKLKSAEGQHGGATKRYDMVFDDMSVAENEQDGKRSHKSSEEGKVNRSATSYHENSNLKKYHESNDENERRERHGNHSSVHKDFKDRVDDKRSDGNRHHYDRDSRHSISDRVNDRRSDRNRSSYDRDERHKGWRDRSPEDSSDRHKSRRDRSPEDSSDRYRVRRDRSPEDSSDRHKGRRDRSPEDSSDRYRVRRDRSPEDGYVSRHRVSSSTQKRHRESSPEDDHEHKHKDRHGRYESSSSRSGRDHRDALAKDNHVHTHRDRDGRHDRSGTQSRHRLESPEAYKHESRDHGSESHRKRKDGRGEK